MSLSKNLEKNSDKEYYVKSILVKIFNLGFFSVFYYLLILAVGKMNMQSPLSALLIIPIAFWVYRAVKEGRLYVLKNTKYWYPMQVVSCIIMIFLAFRLEVDLTWDWGGLLNNAYNYTMTGEISSWEYFVRYPQQQFWIVCLITLFKIVSKCTSSENFYLYKAVSMVVSVIFVQIGIYYIYSTAKLLWDEAKALLVGIIALVYVPFYLYALFLYNDTPGACLAAILMYYFIKLNNTKKWKDKLLCSVIIGTVGAITLKIKIITFIVFVAIIITAFLRNRIKILIALGGVMAITFLTSYKLLEIPINCIFQYSESEINRYEFPSTHYIMMMLNVTGGYIQEDVDYTWSFETYEEKKNANILKIKERLSDRKIMGTIKHILYTKQLRTWANSCIAGDDYSSRKPIHENSLSQKIFSERGKWHWICLLYTWIGHIFLLLGMLLSAILSLKREIIEQKLLVGRIAVFGLWLFLTIWECNSRYLFTMIPVIMLVAAEGFFMLFDKMLIENNK